MSITVVEDGPIRDRGLPVLSRTGGDEDRFTPSGPCDVPMRWETGGGVFAGDDFWGEIDLARSSERNSGQ